MYCGTDIIEVCRIKEAIIKNKNFLKEIFSQNEIDSINKIKSDFKYQRYAARFAGKEAIFKAISKILKENNITFNFNEVEILNNENGKPYVKFLNSNINKCMSNYDIDISLSHIKDTAIAFCIVT